MKTSAVAKLLVLSCVLMFAAVRPTDGLASQAQLSRQQQGRQQQGRQQEITCPVQHIRTAITTAIPNPWWQTPQEGKLQSVDVQVIGGKQTLVCRYDAYGTRVSVMRLFPDGARECRAAGNRFTCR